MSNTSVKQVSQKKYTRISLQCCVKDQYRVENFQITHSLLDKYKILRMAFFFDEAWFT